MRWYSIAGLRLTGVVLSTVLLPFLGACSSSKQSKDLVPGTDVAVEAGVPEAVVFPDVKADGSQDSRATEASIPDIQGEVPGPACAPGGGCFLDKCAENSQCQSGWCVEHLGEGVCSKVCEDECPAGWSCKYMTGTGATSVFACISDFATLCRPCSASVDCESLGGSEDVCVDYGPDGDFCGGKCEGGNNCPWGFSCKDVQTVEGAKTKQCRFDVGVCPCTAKAIELADTTACEVVNEFGSCTGVRLCAPDGLTACSAPVPADETCNGIDDDCDGDVDEPALVEGKLVELCDDGNDCTEDSCAGGDGCMHGALDGGVCDDEDACTGQDHCLSGECTGVAVVCDDGNPCTDDTCKPEAGCQSSLNTAPCDDGNGCTTKDTCSEGACVGEQTIDCKCTTDQECKQFDDEDLCNGVLKCIGQQCVTDPTTVVVCDSSNTPTCHVSVCVPETGKCIPQAAQEGTPCDDGDMCTGVDACQAGECQSGAAVICEDGNMCTEDTCQPATGCMHADKSPMCNDSNPCTDDACDPGIGCTHTDNTDACDDGNKCTTGETCKSGACAGGTAVSCDDVNVCTSDTCVPAAGCVYVNNNGPCDDGAPCTENDLCQGGICVGTGSPSCDDGNDCTKDYCTNPAGCIHKPLTGTACEDGNLCLAGDSCVAGVCQSGESPVSCDDGNPCTDDSCNDPAVGCVHTHNTAYCDDGNACTEDDFCFGGKCYGGPQANCDDKLLCTSDSCDHGKGCLHVPNDSLCSDGNGCTDDSCSPQEGCLHNPDDSLCNDGNVCTDDVCSLQVGCQFWPNKAPCTDHNVCTVTDSCSGGLCVGSSPLGCDDANICTEDSCEPQSGCSHVPSAEGQQCGATPTWVCDAAQCLCKPDCAKKACGDDGCGDTCGTCPKPQDYCSAGQCVCVPACQGKSCGQDGCGGTCGTCPLGFACANDECTPDCTSLGDLKDSCPHTYPNNLNSIEYTDGITLEAWVKWFNDPDSPKDQYILYQNHPNNPIGDTASISLNSAKSISNSPGAFSDSGCESLDIGGGIVFRLSSGNKKYCLQTRSGITSGDWHHVAGTYNTKAMTIYIDGKNAASMDTESFSLTLPMSFGVSCEFNGAVSSVMVSKTALYNTTFTPAKPLLQSDATVIHFYFHKYMQPKIFDMSGSGLYFYSGNGMWGDGAPIDSCCSPSCDGKSCGPNGCGGFCGQCPSGSVCSSGKCVSIVDRALFAGTFGMGCKTGINVSCHALNTPDHQVKLSEYSIDQHEVTVEQFRACVNAGACLPPGCTDKKMDNYLKPEADKWPVNCVRWLWARDYCFWSDAHLCTEAQWELAAGGGDDREYPWGGAAPSCNLTVMAPGNDESSYGCGTGHALPVGSKGGDWRDFGGNVSEWVNDFFDGKGYTPGLQIDPTGPLSGSDRVFRGGSFIYGPSACMFRIYERGSAQPNANLFDLGFRCCK